MNPSDLLAVKKSYLNILGFFFEKETIETRYMRCLLKWGFQLHFKPEDLTLRKGELEQLSFLHPTDKVQRLEAIYHLVCLINMDRLVEDVELEVASLYAVQLGFPQTLVSDLLKAIATYDDDGVSHESVHQDVLDFLKIQRL